MLLSQLNLLGAAYRKAAGSLKQKLCQLGFSPSGTDLFVSNHLTCRTTDLSFCLSPCSSCGKPCGSNTGGPGPAQRTKILVLPSEHLPLKVIQHVVPPARSAMPTAVRI